jgi:TatD DNase family protein
MIDTHCHLDFKEYNNRRDEVIKTAVEAGVHTLVNIGADKESTERSVQLAEKYDNVYATVGIHPHDAKTFDDKFADRLVELTEHEKVKAIGEIGLDYYRDLSPRDIQRDVFHRQLDIAVQSKMPVVIHTRESFKDTLDIIRKYASKLPGGIFHCFPGTVNDAYDVIDIGFHLSVGGVITFPKARMAEIAEKSPLEWLLLETDSPFLTPVPFRGKTNQPAYVKYVCDKVASLRKKSFSEIEKATDLNAQKVYRLVEVFGE